MPGEVTLTKRGEPTLLRKAYSSAFVLDAAKLSRILTILEQRAGDPPSSGVVTFSARLRDGKELELSSSQDVLALDNTVKNPIDSLRINLTPADWYRPTATIRFESDRSDNVGVTVGHDNGKEANELFAELEEQVERTFSTGFIHTLKRLDAFLLFAIVSAFLAVLAGLALPSLTPPSLPYAQASSLSNLFSSARTDTEKLDALIAAQRAQLSLISAPARISGFFTLRILFIALPVVVLLFALGYMVVTCYPRAVFAWGDYEEHFKTLSARRNIVITVVAATLVLGVLTNLFVASLPALR